MKPRVFVSSVVEGFIQCREATRKGIEAGECEPVMVNENFPALDKSSRNACLDGVESCDAVVVVVGSRGGWRAPSGKLVVEEEFEHARSRGMPTFVFLQETNRDSDADSLCMKLGDFVDGNFRRTFTSPAELTKLVKAACAPLNQPTRGTMDTARFNALLLRPEQMRQEPVLRVVVAPERSGEEVFPIEVLDDEEFNESLIELARKRSVGIFDPYVRLQQAKTSNSLVISAIAENGSPAGQSARLEVNEAGWLVFDLSLRDPGGSYEAVFYPVAVEDIEQRAATAFKLTKAIYEKQDPFARYATLLVNASLGHLGHQMLAFRKDREQMKGRVNMHSTGHGAHATPGFDNPERVTRSDSRWIEDVAAKVARRIERRQNHGGDRASFGQ